MGRHAAQVGQGVAHPGGFPFHEGPHSQAEGPQLLDGAPAGHDRLQGRIRKWSLPPVVEVGLVGQGWAEVAQGHGDGGGRTIKAAHRSVCPLLEASGFGNEEPGEDDSDAYTAKGGEDLRQTLGATAEANGTTSMATPLMPSAISTAAGQATGSAICCKATLRQRDGPLEEQPAEAATGAGSGRCGRDDRPGLQPGDFGSRGSTNTAVPQQRTSVAPLEPVSTVEPS